MAKWVKGKVAEILRAEGFVPLPRMWCLPEEMSQIIEICQQHEEHVSAVRAYVKRKMEEEKAWAMKD